MFKTISPIDNSIYVERPYASSSEIENTLKLSEKSKLIWKNTSLDERKKLVSKFVECFLSNNKEIEEELCKQMGRPLSQCGGEMRGFEERAKYMIDNADRALAKVISKNNSEFDNYVIKNPLGTIFVIAPWNYPYNTSVNSIVPSLLAGNCVVLKHSSQTPLCAEQLLKAAKKAEIPENVFQILHLDHASTSKVISDSRIDHVLFTGSVSGGREVKKAIGTRFIGAGLELGGKDPAYVRADAKLDGCVNDLVDGAFFNSGQSCCGIERIYVEESLYPQFVEAYVEQVKNYTLDNPLLAATTLGPMVRTSAADWVRQQTSEAIAKGAQACIDPREFANSRDNSPYLAPQVLLDVDHSMSVMREESFGPVVGIMSVRSDEQALQLMNDSDLGLTASLWSTDQAAVEALGDRLQTGTVFMNRCDYLDPALCWTGVKNTGRGAALSKLGYLQLSRAKSFHLKTV